MDVTQWFKKLHYDICGIIFIFYSDFKIMQIKTRQYKENKRLCLGN